MENRLIVKKVLDIVLDYDICCNLCNEIMDNYIEECPICNQKNIELKEYGSLETYFTGKRDYCTCSNCKSRFKLVSDEWYYPSFPEPVGDETEVVLIPFDKNSQ